MGIPITDSQTLQVVYSNYCRILSMLTSVIANPTQTNIDTLCEAATGAQIVRPKPTVTLDGETYNWMEYQQFIITNMEALRTQMVEASGPFMIVNYGR